MAEFFAGKDWQTFMQILPTIPFETWACRWGSALSPVNRAACVPCPAG